MISNNCKQELRKIVTLRLSFRIYQELFTETIQVTFNYWSIKQSISLTPHRIQKKLGQLILTKVN